MLFTSSLSLPISLPLLFFHHFLGAMYIRRLLVLLFLLNLFVFVHLKPRSRKNRSCAPEGARCSKRRPCCGNLVCTIGRRVITHRATPQDSPSCSVIVEAEAPPTPEPEIEIPTQELEDDLIVHVDDLDVVSDSDKKKKKKRRRHMKNAEGAQKRHAHQRHLRDKL